MNREADFVKLRDQLSKSLMTSIFKIVSFYLSLVVLISLTFLFSKLAGKYETYLTLSIWIAYCGIPLTILSYIFGTHKLRYWSEPKTIAPSIVILIGHLGPVHAIYYYIQMAKAGYGSGIVFIPSILWVFLFYGVGAFWCISRIAAIKVAEGKY